MSEPTWQKLKLEAATDAVQAIEDFKSSAEGVIGVVETVVGMAKTVADLILAIYVDLANLELEAIRAAISALRDIVADFQKSVGTYMLFVPMKIVDPFLWFGDPKTFYLGNRDTKLSTPILSTYEPFPFVKQPAGGTGGNYGFYATVVESLRDYDDPNRPDLDEDAYIASAVFLFGADAGMELVVLLKKLMRLFNLPNIDLAPDTVPIPQNMRYAIVPQPLVITEGDDPYITGKGDLTTQPHAIKIEWDKDSKDWLNAAYGESTYTEIDRVYLYRWEEGIATPEQVRAGVRAGVSVFSQEYEETTPLFIDTDVEPGKVYYYGLSYSYNVLNADGDVRLVIEPPDVDLVSLRVDLPADIKIGPSRGTPPDWFSMSLIPAIPPLQKVLRFVLDWLDRIEASVRTGKDDLQDFVDFLEKELNRYHLWITEISNEIQELVDALTFPEAYAGMLAIEGKGGNQFFLDQLGRSLFREGDPNRPPFDNGTEAVAGIIMLAGAETPGKLEKFWTTLNLLFGSMLSSTDNKLAEAIASLGGLSDELDRQICLTQSMVETECDGTTDENTTMGRDLEPSTESPDCQAAAQEAYDNFLKGDS